MKGNVDRDVILVDRDVIAADRDVNLVDKKVTLYTFSTHLTLWGAPSWFLLGEDSALKLGFQLMKHDR